MCVRLKYTFFQGDVWCLGLPKKYYLMLFFIVSGFIALTLLGEVCKMRSVLA